jgi:hypothetical protein
MRVGEAGVVRLRGTINVTTGGRIRRVTNATTIIIEIGEYRVINAETTANRCRTGIGTEGNQLLRVMLRELMTGIGIIRKGRRETAIRRRCGRNRVYGHNN